MSEWDKSWEKKIEGKIEALEKNFKDLKDYDLAIHNQEQIAKLQKIIDMQYSDPVKYKGEYKPTRFEKWQTKQMNKDYLLHKEWAVPQINGLKEFLRDYFKYRKDWSELIMKKSPFRSPLDTWMMISLHKFMKDALETLDTPKPTEKKEIPSENLRTCSECQKIFESIKLRKNHEHCIHGIGEFIKDSEGEKEVEDTGLNTGHIETVVESIPLREKTDSKPSESEKEFEFQLIEKFIPPRNIKCTDCMNNPVPKLIKEFIQKLKLLNNGCDPYPNDPLDIVIKEYEGMLEE